MRHTSRGVSIGRVQLIAPPGAPSADRRPLLRLLFQRFLRFSTLFLLNCDQLVRNIVFVDVGNVIDGFRANTISRNEFDVIYPDVGIEVSDI